MRNMGGLPQAYHFAKAATEIRPHDAPAWTNLGHAASSMWLIEEAERCYKRGLQCAKTDFDRFVLWTNLGALYLDTGQFDKALEYTQKVLEVDPEHRSAKTNVGFCKLARGDWSGWAGYHGTIGSDWRPKVRYKEEPEWDGTPGKTVVLYADQGLGDEILFASMLADAASVCRKLILDCDGRLESLFKRSFPNVTVYGTRTKTERWAKEDRQIDASLPLGQVGEFFRLTNESFPRVPYLVPCPDRVKQWKALFAEIKPVIGIAWSGGVPKTGQRQRYCPLSNWIPLFDAVDAHYVSLQYRDASQEIAEFRKTHPVELVQYPWGTLTADYDDTAALVASLDAVVAVPTAVVHLSGALGTPTFAMKAASSCWKYSCGLPFHPATLIEYQGSWKKTIETAVPLVQAHLESSSATTPGNHLPTTSCSTPLRNTPAGRLQ
jgi:tetratricopeptide (TPR) repeat protein